MNDFLRLENLNGDFKNLLDSVRGGKAITAFSLAQGGKIHVGSALQGLKLYITTDRLAADTAYERFKGYLGDRVVLVADKDDVLLHRASSSLGNTGKRIDALSKIVTGRCDVAVMPVEALVQYYPNVQKFKSSHITLIKEEEYPIDKIVNTLIDGGYSRSNMAETKGTFSLRGDILDIFPLSFENPIRINFFDDYIESIKYFNAENMESVEEIDSVIIPPSSDIILGVDGAREVIDELKNVRGGAVTEIIDDVIGKLELCPNDKSLVWITPFIKDKSVIFDYLPREAIVILDEPKLLNDKLELIEKEHLGRFKSLLDGGGVTEKHKKAILSRDEAVMYTKVFTRLGFQQLTSINPIFTANAQYSFKSQQPTKYYLDKSVLFTDLKNFNASGYRVMLCAGDKDRQKVVSRELKENDIFAECADEFTLSKIIVSSAKISAGFIYHAQKLVVLGTEELFSKNGQKREFTKQKSGFIQLNTGDYVVHEVHGVGVCEGSEKINVGGIQKDYVVLRYRDGDKLYVPIDQMDMLTKFSGDETPKLNKIGGKEFQKVKEKAKASVRKMAIDLLTLYAEREKQVGFKYSPDTVWQREFEDNFEYELTPDQDTAITEIKKEMEKGRVIDRLICGDVGYGKTEVALRASFKTIMDNKQVAILAPTTILAKQHFNTLNTRLEGLGVKTALLSRLQSQKEVTEILKEVKEGIISIVVGTHRLLSKDVVFHDLGLLVLDEEQRFGVEHKEKIKTVKKDVNVLTLTATPIPRTLNLALTGVRDISLLETPPKNRLPVQNYIIEYSDTLLKDAISREIGRGGQVFVLYNYVESIESFADKVRGLLGGTARVLVAHGQMSGAELDLRMTKFYQKEADVLIATTIIENGIDLPDANTLFVIDADRFGLAQLYQLRGRVGRSGALAHAYFTTKLNKVLTEDAVKRLTALTEYADFGSGFKISLRDLEIRGAGNFLGAEQHGHIAKVGYELYTKMLTETVQELKNGGVKETNDVEIKIDADAYVSENYVNQGDKIKIYKRISDVHTVSERDELIEMLTDVYGKPERPLVNLINIALLKSLAGNFDIVKIIINKKGAAFIFRDAEIFREQFLIEAVSKCHEDVVLTATLPPELLFNTKNLMPEDIINKMINFLILATRN